jgi:hypothetical protein
MKIRLTIFALFVVFFIGALTTEMNAQKKYYIVFNNFEDDLDIEHPDGSMSKMVEHLYYSRISEDDLIKDYAEMKPFGPATFAARAITEYDVAIFPLGDVPLQASVGGIKILDKIKEMLDAGKGVIIIGRSYMMQSASDGAASDFLTKTLRIDHDRYLTSETSGNTTTFVRFDLQAVENDPVGQGWLKVCNSKFQENNSEMAPPLYWYTSADFFTVDESSMTTGFDKVHPAQGDLFAGARWSNEKGGRLVFWSVGFDVATTIHDDRFGTELINAIHWITERMLKPEQWIEAEVNKLDFEKVEPGEFKVEELRIRNYGKENLTITETYVENFFSDEGIYTITEGEITPDNPVVLGPNEFTSIKVKFAPVVEDIFDDALIIKSDAFNTSSLTITLTGQGGDQVEKGPRISKYEFPVDFGEIYVGDVVNKDIPITNTGNVALIVFTLDTVLNEGGSFRYRSAISTPQVIQPGESYNIPMRFVPLKGDRIYRGQIKITSNANNVDTSYIDLIGKTLLDKYGPEAKCETKDIAWGEVVTYEDFTFKLESTGDMDLLVSDIFVDGNNEAQEVFQVITETQASITPGETFDVTVRFEPKQNKKYAADLVIISNAKVHKTFYIPLFGTGIVSVNENGAELNELFTMKASPSPVTGLSYLKYNLLSETSKHINIYMTDEAGNVISNFVNDIKSPGEHEIRISADNYSSGAYYIIAEIDGKQSVLPLMITK